MRERLNPPDPGADRWRLSIRDDPATEKTPLVQALEHTTLPFFAQFASLLDVRDYLRRAPSDPPRLELAMAEALLGDPQAARNLFDAFVAARPGVVTTSTRSSVASICEANKAAERVGFEPTKVF